MLYTPVYERTKGLTMKAKNLWYSLILGILFAFCLGTNVFAAVSRVTTSFNTTSAGTFTIGTQTYTSVMPTQVDFEDTTPDEYHGTYEITHNIDLVLTSTNKYLTGSFVVQIITTVGNGDGTVSAGTLDFQPIQDDGLHVYLYEYAPTQYRLVVIMDNYSPRSGIVSLGTITTTYNVIATNPNNAGLDRNFTTSITKTSGGSVEAYEAPINDRFTAMLWSAINQATGPDLASIINLLTDIRNQDLTYYNSLISGLSSIQSELGTQSTVLNNILNEMDMDFQSVQTVLDLFPAYSQSVLNYWQQFLQMNASQASEAAEQESKYADGESQASNMVSNMEAVGLPSISNGDLDILGTIDGTQKNNFFGVIALITHTEIVTKIMLIIVIGAMVGFIMYGKKGG